MTTTPGGRAAGALVLTRPRLRTWHLAAIALACAAVTYGVFQVTPLQGRADGLVVAGALFLVVSSLTAWAVEGPRAAKDRLLYLFVVTCFVLAMLPLASLLGYTVERGVGVFNADFFQLTMKGVTPLRAGGGLYHSLIGTAEQVGLATLIAVPLGLLVAIFTTEYGAGRLARAVTFFIDVMTGVPSIVAGLFVFAFWVIGLHQGFSGFAAAMALAILMLPIVVRSAEEMIRLVPDSLREAAYALGVARSTTILRVVLPTAAGGIVTGVMLAVARVVGETAPLLLTSAGFNFENRNPFSGAQDSVPLFVFNQATSSSRFNVDRAWGGALALVLLILLLNLVARAVARRSKGSR